MARTLVRNAAIVTMDDAIGEITGDVLIENDRIAALAPRIEGVGDADVIDATGFIVIPGLINAHMHKIGRAHV